MKRYLVLIPILLVPLLWPSTTEAQRFMRQQTVSGETIVANSVNTTVFKLDPYSAFSTQCLFRSTTGTPNAALHFQVSNDRARLASNVVNWASPETISVVIFTGVTSETEWQADEVMSPILYKWGRFFIKDANGLGDVKATCVNNYVVGEER